MSYSDITFKDKNRIKRWLQNQRLVSAIKLGIHTEQCPKVICDFGAGNGELCKLLLEHFPEARIICYEPAPQLLDEARDNLKGISNVEFFQQVCDVEMESVDLLFCLEVFEHLPLKETQEVIHEIENILTPEGRLIVGVPVEIGIPALYKGIFRMIRRYGAFDANIKNVLSSSIGYPPKNRPSGEIAPGFRFHFEHTGFDFRSLNKTLGNYFTILSITTSPFPKLGAWLMPEIYFTTQKR